jgi:hypothetical protein
MHSRLWLYAREDEVLVQLLSNVYAIAQTTQGVFMWVITQTTIQLIKLVALAHATVAGRE